MVMAPAGATRRLIIVKTTEKQKSFFLARNNEVGKKGVQLEHIFQRRYKGQPPTHTAHRARNLAC